MSRKERHPPIVRLTGPDGVERLYMPVPGEPKGPEEWLPAEAVENARRYLETRRGPISPSMLARMVGVSRFKIYDDIHRGVFPDGSVTRAGVMFRISASAALWYIDQITYDPKE